MKVTQSRESSCNVRIESRVPACPAQLPLAEKTDCEQKVSPISVAFISSVGSSTGPRLQQQIDRKVERHMNPANEPLTRIGRRNIGRYTIANYVTYGKAVHATGTDD
jgi:hypothetical protein